MNEEQILSDWERAIRGRSAKELASALRAVGVLRKSLTADDPETVSLLALAEALLGAGLVRAARGDPERTDGGLRYFERGVARAIKVAGAGRLRDPARWTLAARAVARAAGKREEGRERSVKALRRLHEEETFGEALRAVVGGELEGLGVAVEGPRRPRSASGRTSSSGSSSASGRRSASGRSSSASRSGSSSARSSSSRSSSSRSSSGSGSRRAGSSRRRTSTRKAARPSEPVPEPIRPPEPSPASESSAGLVAFGPGDPPVDPPSDVTPDIDVPDSDIEVLDGYQNLELRPSTEERRAWSARELAVKEDSDEVAARAAAAERAGDPLASDSEDEEAGGDRSEGEPKGRSFGSWDGALDLEKAMSDAGDGDGAAGDAERVVWSDDGAEGSPEGGDQGGGDGAARSRRRAKRSSVEVLAPGNASLADALASIKEGRLALQRRQREGDPEGLTEAEAIAKEVLAAADPAGPPAAMARALLAEVALERGDEESALREIEAAQRADPENEDVLAAAVRLRAGDAATAPTVAALRYAIARAREELLDDRPKKAIKVLVRTAERHDDEPWLLAFAAWVALERLERDDLADEYAMRARRGLPPKISPALGLGDDLETDVAAKLVRRAGKLVTAEGPKGRLDLARRGETESHVAGAWLLLGLGLARYRLYAPSKMGKSEQARIRVVVADALFLLQFYDAAAAEYDRARSTDRSAQNDARNGIDQCQSMKLKSVDDETIVVRAGAYKDPLSVAVGTYLLERGTRLRKASREADLEGRALQKAVVRHLVEELQDGADRFDADSAVGAALASVIAAESELSSLRSSLEHLDGGLADENGEPPEADAEGKRGLFSRIKKGIGAAAGRAKDLANRAQLAVRINTAEAKTDRLIVEAGRKVAGHAVEDDVPDDDLSEEARASLARVRALRSLEARFAAEDRGLRDHEARLAKALGKADDGDWLEALSGGALSS